MEMETLEQSCFGRPLWSHFNSLSPSEPLVYSFFELIPEFKGADDNFRAFEQFYVGLNNPLPNLLREHSIRNRWFWGKKRINYLEKARFIPLDFLLGVSLINPYPLKSNSSGSWRPSNVTRCISTMLVLIPSRLFSELLAISGVFFSIMNK